MQKEILLKDIRNLSSRWQALLSTLEFDTEFIKGENNNLPNFLTHEFLQDP